MGMFDYIRLDVKLPHGKNGASVFQTKDTPRQLCDEYLVDAFGQLHHLSYELEDRSDPNAEGIAAIAGMMTRVNKRWVPQTYTGTIVFYDTLTEPAGRKRGDGWIELEAKFINGVISGDIMVNTLRRE